MAEAGTTTKVPTFCPLCVSRCGATATIVDGEFVALDPDPGHPTGQALCVKGKSAPDVVPSPYPHRVSTAHKPTDDAGMIRAPDTCDQIPIMV